MNLSGDEINEWEVMAIEVLLATLLEVRTIKTATLCGAVDEQVFNFWQTLHMNSLLEWIYPVIIYTMKVQLLFSEPQIKFHRYWN